MSIDPPLPTVFTGLRVLDCSTGMAGPLATMILADYGADVVKVESATGDWARQLDAFALWNRGKRSIVLDLGVDAMRRQARSLVEAADVLVENGGPRLRAGLGLDGDCPPWLVHATIDGFGGLASMPGVRAYEATVSAAVGRMTGLDRLSGGHPGVVYDRPAFTAAPIASYGAALLAVNGIVAALIDRERTGDGQHVQTSLLQGAIAFLMRQELARGDGAGTATIAEATHRGIELCFLTAECADGRYIQMCARQDQHFRNWLLAVGLNDVLDDPVYARAPMGIPTVAAVNALEVRLRERMKTRTQTEWMRIFTEEHDVGGDPFLTPDEFLQHPDMVANDRVAEVVDPVLGPTRQLGPLVGMSTTPAVIGAPAPRLDEHAGEVRWSWRRRRRPDPAPQAQGDTDAPGRPRPLEGYTILEVAYYIAGPLATALLAEMGARVIKVEPLDGDPYRRTGLQSAKFLHGKESIAIDLKRAAGQRTLRQLIQRSDAVVHSFRADAAKRLGLDAPSVHAINPRVVHLYAGSYGSHGPQARRAAFHSTPNALSGGGIKQAGADNPPVNDSYPDPGSALGAATALMLGLYAARRSGRGQALETTMLCSTGYIHSADMVRYPGAPPAPVADGQQYGLHARYRLYRARDRWLFLAAPRDEDWERLVGVLGNGLNDARFADRAGRARHDAELADALGRIFAAVDAAAVVARLAAAGVGAAVVSDEPFDQWLIGQGLVTAADHPAYAPYWRLPAKLTFSGSTPSLGPAAAVGEHTRAVLAELGCSTAELDQLEAAGVIGVYRPDPAIPLSEPRR